MKQFTPWLFLLAVTFGFSACHCKTEKCHVGLPGIACTPCPKKPKALAPPKVRKECHPIKWPNRPVKFVTTQVIRKCCKVTDAVSPDGICYQIEECEITYKGIYTDGSSTIWTEVSRNPITSGSRTNNSKKGLHIGSLVPDRGERH